MVELESGGAGGEDAIGTGLFIGSGKNVGMILTGLLSPAEVETTGGTLFLPSEPNRVAITSTGLSAASECKPEVCESPVPGEPGFSVKNKLVGWVGVEGVDVVDGVEGVEGFVDGLEEVEEFVENIGDLCVNGLEGVENCRVDVVDGVDEGEDVVDGVDGVEDGVEGVEAVAILVGVLIGRVKASVCCVVFTCWLGNEGEILTG